MSTMSELDILAPLLDPTPERRAYLDSEAALVDSAIAYAQAGWPVFPVASGGKRPVTRNGVKDATVDVDVVREWWRTMPACNIGVAAGVRFDVIDIDGHNGGFDEWASFTDEQAAAGVALPDVLAVCCTAGEKGVPGRHLYIAPVPGARNGAGLGGRVGLDYRASGGYVLVAPSRLANGGRYEWALEPDHRLLGATTT